MLYVFSVETGTMLTFEMNLAVDTVDVLMCAIAKTCGIPEDKQVLLVSGGSNLDPESKVCEYGSGTDTCPIFLFNKCAIESDISPRPSIGNASGINMPELVEGCLNMPTTYQTVVVRAQLAQQFAELATNELMVCERLVHDQRLQQQGWATVIANLQDATLNCRKGANEMKHIVHQYLESRPSYRAMLLNIQEVIDLLSTIPLLPSLLLKNDSEADRQHSKQTLLDWLSKSQPKSYIENYAVQCLPLIDNFNEDTWSQLEKDIEEVLIDVENKNMKKVKGLEERLYSLDKLMSEAKKYERDQTEQAQNLLNNKVRVSNLQDMSVLPDLCMTHRHQLELMLKNHQNLTEIRERCTRAKIELCSNLHTRLKWILNVENKMFDVNNKLGIYKEYLEILKHHFGTIKEVQSAPTNYLKAVVEVCRRRNFSSNFLKWSWSLSEQSHNLYKNEVTLRKKFNSEFSNSFMKTLFPGMEDFPPPFATERPEPFDLHLPKIIPEDLDRLKQCLPDLVSILEVPQTIEMPHFCVTPDSAFSSEIPSSRAGLASTSGSLGTQLLKTEVKECVSVGDYDYALNECISLTSSPFEDAPLSDDASSKQEKSPLKKKHEEPEVDCKRFHLADCVSDKEAFSPIEEEQHDSDAEEFEQVDDIPKSDEYDTLCRITILTETHDINKDSDLNKTDIGKSCKTSDIVIPKTSSICRVTSPLEERLRSPEAMLTSQDFQPTDYFIDDSMPSSYTESNGTSALSRGNQMVKSHHLIVAELQNQIEEKNVALENAQGNLKMNRTNILKLRRTITALQKYMQDVLDGLRTDLIALKEYVMNEKSLALHQICDIIEEVKTVVAGMQSRIHSEQESTVNDAVRREREMMESVLQKYKYQLETEQQKLFDCHNEIDVYQKQIRQHQIVLEELKEESDHELQELKKDLSDENDQLVKGMILEHELELENLRDILKKTTQEKEGEIREIREALCDKEAQLHLLLTEKENFQVEQMPHLQKEKDLQTYSVEMDNKDKQDETIKQALEQQDNCHKEDLARIKMDYEKHMCEMQEQMKHDLGIEYNEKIQKLKSEMVNEYEQTLAEQRLLYKKEMEDELLQSNQALIAHYEQELESMQLHFKQTYSSSLNKKSCSCHVEEFRDAVPHQLPTLQEMRDFDKDKNLLVSLQDDCLPTETEREENELLELKTTVQRYKEEFEKLKMQHRAKEQVIFNEAISKATREKDILIEELRKQISVLEIQQSSLMSVFDQVTKVIKMVKEEFSSSSCDARFVKNRTAILKKISETQKSVEEIRNGICSSTCVPPVVDDQLTKPDVRKEERICELEMMLQKKEEELGNLKTKFIKLSMYESVRSSLLSDKVSVMSCNVGEIVILYYDEKHENYMVLQFAAAPHFLHSDSFEVLNIKIPPEDPKKHWTLAQVINKEHCQAKKIFNRYKVPYGSRFYRVKVVPWDREAAFQRHSQRRHGQMGASSSSEESGAAAPVFPVSADKASGSQMSASAI